MPHHRYLTSTEVEHLLRVHRNTLWRWRMDGQGPPWVRIEGRVLYPTADLDAWLEARLTKVS